MTPRKPEDQTTRNARRVIRVMDEVRKVAPHCSSNTIIGFLEVATRPGVTVGDVQKACGLPPTATARALSVLFRRARGTVGLNLIEARPDPFDARVKHLYLTVRGERLWKDIRRHLEWQFA